VTSRLVAVMNGSALAGWQLTLGDDSVETYLPNGQLTNITTRAGLVATLFKYRWVERPLLKRLKRPILQVKYTAQEMLEKQLQLLRV
jgi:hypothetical protein